jgi:cell volume regulation protein A
VATDGTLRAMDGLALLAQCGMFLLLGLLVTPREMVQSFWPALALALFLMLLARPLAVWLTLLPFRFAWREVVFIGWVGLRGAVPIVLAMFPLLAGVEGAALLFNVAFVGVLASLLLQGATIGPAARWLGVGLPARAQPLTKATLSEPEQLVAEYSLPSGSPLAGARLASLELPRDTRPVRLLREGVGWPPEDCELCDGDRIVFVTDEAGCERLAELFAPAAASKRNVQRAFSAEFALDGQAPLAQVCALYGAAPDEDDRELTVDAAIRRHLPSAVEGDCVVVAGLEFTVRSLRDGRVAQAGLRLRAPPR